MDLRTFLAIAGTLLCVGIFCFTWLFLHYAEKASRSNTRKEEVR